MQHEMLGNTHPEWARMWESLCDLAGHYTDRNPQSGEAWQYTPRPAGNCPADSGSRALARPGLASRCHESQVLRQLEPGY